MPSSSSQLLLDGVIDTLSALMSGGNSPTNLSQLRHRLNLLTAWLGDPFSESNILPGSTVLEIGCGQGDMTVPLAHFARHVIAVDPAPLDYGAPFTLGQAQDQISRSAQVGEKITWVQSDPIQYIQRTSELLPDFAVLAHSLFYLESEQYFVELLRALAVVARRHGDGKAMKVLIAEWGMRASNSAADAHVLAVKAQAANPITDGNVRTVITPADIQRLASEAGLKIEREVWLACPDVEDGQWEVGSVKTMEYDGVAGFQIRAMERAVAELGDRKIASMDVWTGVFVL
ncbi:uncharacterized protein RCC_03726 [Ramularia collo-cygni]|uniref:Methyltransferase domain-containing protein n=1 Tax=Ramularia collo-cygni TaxID=112498 RepID=A0A2D3V8R6_9PEZI|nr:uncharacterized protein RCC_03726 [Ramularia collo-cygni]CZT17889.1 uncharacterized protein RCC_03726 [Ramularia collo-cygni]